MTNQFHNLVAFKDDDLDNNIDKQCIEQMNLLFEFLNPFKCSLERVSKTKIRFSTDILKLEITSVNRVMNNSNIRFLSTIIEGKEDLQHRILRFPFVKLLKVDLKMFVGWFWVGNAFFKTLKDIKVRLHMLLELLLIQHLEDEAKILDRSIDSTNYCSSCLKHFKKLEKCAICMKDRYCSRSCQKRIWFFHKLFCKPKKGKV